MKTERMYRVESVNIERQRNENPKESQSSDKDYRSYNQGLDREARPTIRMFKADIFAYDYY